MTKLHLKQPGLIDSTCGLFTRHSERIQNLEKQVS